MFRSHPQDNAQTCRLKVDFHLHSAEDPADEIEHTALELLHRAHRLGFHAIAVTLHDHVLMQPELFARAEALGVLMVPGAEMRLEGADVVVLNISETEASSLKRLEDLRTLRNARGNSVFIFAPHPFYRFGGSIGRRAEAYIDVFDAIEYCHFHTRLLNLNHQAQHLAERYGKPLLATSDAHRLDFFGEHYSLVATSAEPSIEDVFDAVRAGSLERVSPAWPVRKFLQYLVFILLIHPARSLARKLER